MTCKSSVFFHLSWIDWLIDRFRRWVRDHDLFCFIPLSIQFLRDLSKRLFIEAVVFVATQLGMVDSIINAIYYPINRRDPSWAGLYLWGFCCAPIAPIAWSLMSLVILLFGVRCDPSRAGLDRGSYLLRLSWRRKIEPEKSSVGRNAGFFGGRRRLFGRLAAAKIFLLPRTNSFVASKAVRMNGFSYL